VNRSKVLDSFTKAKNYAFLLLKFRLRSERELYSRLKKKDFPESIIRKTISFLKEKGFIDDSVFAKNWISSRLKRPFGLRRITQELKLKGVDREVIAQQVQGLKGNYCEEKVVEEIARFKLNKLKNVEPQKARSRLYGYLIRRGFSSEVIIDVINKLERKP
jgi:regulatory protein